MRGGAPRLGLAGERGDRANTRQEQRTDRQQTRQDTRGDTQDQRTERRDTRQADRSASGPDRGTRGTSGQTSAARTSGAATDASRGYGGQNARTTADRILAVIPPVSAFVAAGFEHSVANMYFLPVAWFIRSGAPDVFWTSAATTPAAFSGLTWRAILIQNLLPVTIGNILGGAAMVGGVYWFVYLRPRRASSGRSGPGGVVDAIPPNRADWPSESEETCVRNRPR